MEIRKAIVSELAVKRLPFGARWMGRYLPHYTTAKPSRLHADLATDLKDFHLTRGRRENRIAPRGGGKSTWSTKGYPLYAACEGIEPYILILSETAEQSTAFLRDIRDELENNPILARDYGSAVGRGPVWRDNVLRLRNGVMIRARGVGGSIRGLTNRSSRPSLVVVDDPNEDGDAYSPTTRSRKLSWFNKAVMNVGGPDTNVIVLGTAIHRQAIVYELYRGESAAAWSTRSYRSIIQWPDRMDLWGEWEGLLANLSDPDRLKTARAYYEAHRAEMDAGAEVLWPEREPLYALMLHRVAVGRAAFDCEKQDRPGTDGATEWPAEWFDWPDRWFSRWPEDLMIRLYTIDPSKGITDKPGDYQAHIWGGMDIHGTIYLDAEFRREPVNDMVERAIDRTATWRIDSLDFEANNTMGLLEPEFARQVAARHEKNRPVLVPWRAVEHTDPKLYRIRHGGKYLGMRHPEHGPMVRIKDTPGGRMLVDQWRDVPNGEYDDGPDAVGTFIRRLEELVNPPR